MDTKVCSKCLKSKPLIEFHFRKNGKPYSYCKSCHRLYTTNHYRSNKTYYITKAKNNDIKKRKWVQSFKDRPCTDCRIKYPPYVMDFDHLKNKKFTISVEFLSRTKEEILKEISKCDVVCSNCHRIRTHNRNK